MKNNIQCIVIYANTICNATCSMCDIGLGTEKGIAKDLGNEKFFSTELFTKILSDPLINNKRISFNFLMTEPLLSKNLSEMISMASDKGHNTVITTNAFLLKRKAPGLIDAGLKMIQVSLDGPEYVHDTIRGGNFFKKSNSWDKYIKGKFKYVCQSKLHNQ